MKPGNEPPRLGAEAWTGGQWSFVRAGLGVYLVLHFALLVPWGPEVFSRAGALPEASLSPLHGAFPGLFSLFDGPLFVQGVLVAGVVLAALLALGWRDRIAALLLWYLWASLFVRNPLIANPSLPYVGLLLLVHAGLPRAPYGSLEARGRPDPGGGWSFPRPLFAVLWIALAVGYGYSGATKLVSPSWVDGTALERVLENPLVRPDGPRHLLLALPSGLLRVFTWGALAFELAFPLLALARRLRPLAWGAMLAMHFGLILVIDFADLSLGMVLVHLATFDPSWLPPRRAALSLFYDGDCGLCHRTVRLVLAEDHAGALRVAPLQSGAFERALPAAERADLPDSVVVVGEDGRPRVRTEAVRLVLESLGGYWRVAGFLLRLVPRPLRDLGYDGVARVRKRLFAPPGGACPLVPPHLGERFLPLD